MRLMVPTLLLLVGCATENTVHSLCGSSELAFDITEASVLEDAQGYTGMHDAVILEFDDSQLEPGTRWRVQSVDIMPMIGASEFDSYRDGQRVSVEVFDAADPHGTPWVVTQPFDKGDHEWEDVSLTNPSEAWETQQKRTWWEFDFRDTIPTDGMTGPEYLVGVVWQDENRPTLGYSNFNRDCGANWTDYNDGFGWVNNDQYGTGGYNCSWPMLRVSIEVLEEAPECDESSVVVE